MAVLRGLVRDDLGLPVEGARIQVPSHPEYGWTLTRADGQFDLTVNGGQPLRVDISASGFLRTQRELVPTWRSFEQMPALVLVPLDNHATSVNFTNAAAPALVQGPQVTDARGTRAAHVYVPPQTQAGLSLPDGGFQQVGGLHIRITEYTKGDAGVASMPGLLPPSSAFTYAAELSADEADAVDATSVVFDRPLYHYVDNFLGFPVGQRVPVGAYDRGIGRWVPSDDGRVVKVLSSGTAGVELDGNGDGLADDAAQLAGLDITPEELLTLASLYPPGQSFWRVPVAHFTPWDCNWPYQFPTDSQSPGENGASAESRRRRRLPGEPCEKNSSVIECEPQVLGERIPLAGTDMDLNYRSDRHGTGSASIYLVLTGPTVPASLRTVSAEIEVAGVTTRRTYAPLPNVTDTFTWDGLDAYGRQVFGSQQATVRIRFGYEAVYNQGNGTSFRSFNSLPDSTSFGVVFGSSSLPEFQMITEWTALVNAYPNAWADTGGWSLAPHHVFDTGAEMLHLGNGKSRPAQVLTSTVRRLAGLLPSTSGNSTSTRATERSLGSPNALAVMPDGSFYVGTTAGLKHVDAQGTLSSITPVSNPGDACAARVSNLASEFAWDGANNLYFVKDAYTSGTTGGWGMVCRLDLATRKVHHVAGVTTAETSTCTTGVASTIVLGDSLGGIAVGPDGTVFVSDNSSDCVRRIQLDGTVERILGGGTSAVTSGVDARTVRVSNPQGLDVGPDGSLYVAGYGDSRLYRVGPDGRLTILAGLGATASTARTALSSIRAVKLSPEGYVYFGQDGSSAPNRGVRRLSPAGVIDGFLGNGSGFQDYAAPEDVATPSPLAISFFPDHTEEHPAVAVAVGTTTSSFNNRVVKVASVSRELGEGDILVPNGDTRELYVFDASGRHLSTRHLITGAILWSFSYDADGRLASVTGPRGGLTTLTRNTAGDLTALTGPFGATHAVTLDASGYLSTVTSPAGCVTRVTHSAEGLLTEFVQPDGTRNQFFYDGTGRLTEDRRDDGTSLLLAGTPGASGAYSVTVTQPGGEATRYDVQYLDGGITRRLVTLPSGATRAFDYGEDGDFTSVLPDGTTTSVTWAPDPRFGMQMPYASNVTSTYPSGRTLAVTHQRSVTLSNPDDRTSWSTWTERVGLGGADAGVETLDRGARTSTMTDGAGLTTVLEWDTQGRTTRIQRGPGTLDVALAAWDAQGRLSEVSTGTGSWRYAYDASGYLQSRTSALGHVTTWTHDADGRVTSVSSPAGAVSTFAWDSGNNLASLSTTLGTHAFGHRFDGRLASHTPPGNGVPAFTRTFDANGRTSGRTWASGKATTWGWDADGRLASVAWNDGTLALSWPASGDEERPSAVVLTPAASTGQLPVGLSFQYDGPLWSRVESTGPSPSVSTFTWNASGRLASLDFTTGSTRRTDALTYGTGGRLSGDGRLTFAWTGVATRPSSASDGSTAVQSYGYDSQGRFASRELRVAGNLVYRVELSRDADGRVSGASEQLGAQSRLLAYTHAASGALTAVGENGTPSESFSYDANGNRTLAGAEAATFDAQDRLLTRGSTAYQLDADGTLVSRGTDTFRYDAQGLLVSASVGGTPLAWQYDGLKRRVARITPAGTTQYFYADPRAPYRLTGYALPGEAPVLLRYDPHGHLFSLEQSGTVTYAATDALGSVRALVDGAGNVLREVRYGAFGNVTSDSSPGTPLPVGYAGGLQDELTGFVLFGLRDY
ncbi:MAG: hypothetical protein FJ086_09515, partial [Deltaproteobacteria bacterium]|nr:hypothetical protein [Deltaproteobacteria bacterium]